MLRTTINEHERNSRIKISVSVSGRIDAVKWSDTKEHLEFIKFSFKESSKEKREMKLVHV
jgi:hypothetical protein